MTAAPKDDLPETLFAGRFESPTAMQGRLRIRALRGVVKAQLNGETLPLVSDGRHWKEYQEIPVQVRAGANDLAVSVVNPTGPGLLSLRLEGPPDPFISDVRFRARYRDLPARPARRIGGAPVNPNSFTLPSPAEGFAARWSVPLIGFVLGISLFQTVLAPRSRALRARARWGWLAAGTAGLWLALLVNAASIPLSVGFDARHHLDYVEFLLERGALPLATDGWSMFHPPVYYVPTALLVALQRWLAPASETLLAWKLVGWAGGLATALLCGAAARRLCGTTREAALAAGFAALLPMNLYISSYVTNESLTATACTALVLATLGLLLRGNTLPRDAALWALLAAAAVLTKYTAWIVAGVAGLFLLVAWVRVEKPGASAVGARVGLAVLGVAVLAGWFYGRNLLHFGEPFPLNTDLPDAVQVWWQQPGYATPAFFLRFGAVLGHPFLAGFHVAWDSFYSTLWGDGQLAGQVTGSMRHPHWDWDLMALGYALALPASAAVLLGAGRSLQLALRDSEAGQRAAHSFLLTLSWTLLLSVLFMTLRQPDYGQAKAFYALAGIAPLSIFFGLGCGAADRWLEAHAGWGRPLLWGWIGATALSFALAYVS